MVSRRDALKTLAAASAFRLKPEATQDDAAFRLKPEATQDDAGFRLEPEGTQDNGGFRLQPEDPTLQAIAAIVIPAEADRAAALHGFTDWIANYKEGADTDHGYGNTRVRPTGLSPARNYPTQIAALDAAAKAAGAASFSAASLDQRRSILETAIANAKVERLSARPTGGHIATDLMGHYFGSSEATDLCYDAAIGRDACRGLAGSEQAPARRAARGARREVR